MVLERVVGVEGLGALTARELVLAVHLLVLYQLVLNTPQYLSKFLLLLPGFFFA